MRRALILALLVVGVRLLLPLGTAGRGAQALLTFGFLILAAYTVGELADAARLPRVVGYLGAGVLFGPSALDVVPADAVARLAPVSGLAIALIAFLAGAELRWEEVRARGGAISRILASELTLAFAAIAGTLVLLRDHVPFLAGAPWVTVAGFAILFAALAVVHSPAVTIALLTETGARGPVARTTLGVVLVSDVVVVLLFSGALAAARALVPPTGAEVGGASLGAVAWELGGAVLVGGALGAVVALYLRTVQRELVLFAVLVAFLGAELARLAHVEALLALLVAGFVTENVSPRERGEALRHAVERAGAPVFVVFFALAGAGIALGELAAVWPLVIPLVLARAGAMWAGCRLGARWARLAPPADRYVWMGLVSQAGVAIGLAAVVTEVYPVRGASIRTLFLATLAVNQTLGPILFRIALAKSGELAPASNGLRADATVPAHG